MSNNKTARYLLSGCILAYFGLKNLEDFYVFYEGIAIAASICAFAFAYLEWKKNKSNS